MKRSGEFKEELKELLLSLKETPFIKRVFIYDNENSYDSCYGWIETIENDVIYIQRSIYVYFGWDLSYEYNVTKENGTGCRCNEDSMPIITETNIKDAALYGRCFCLKNKAVPYRDFDDFKLKSWCKEYIKEL